MSTKTPEAKVIAGTAGAGLGAVIAGFAVWLLDEYLFRAGPVPVEVSTLVLAGVPVLASYVAGWLAPHTRRPDLEPLLLPLPDVHG